jgi:hypothetical protein
VGKHYEDSDDKDVSVEDENVIVSNCEPSAEECDELDCLSEGMLDEPVAAAATPLVSEEDIYEPIVGMWLVAVAYSYCGTIFCVANKTHYTPIFSCN